MKLRSYLKVRTDWAVSDPTALPLRFYNQTGQLTWQSPKRTLWGKAYQAHDELGLNELRFAGQQYDAESGLCYNRFRYYHPDSGCYLSPDPLGLMGGLNTHAYVPNPTVMLVSANCINIARTFTCLIDGFCLKINRNRPFDKKTANILTVGSRFRSAIKIMLNQIQNLIQ